MKLYILRWNPNFSMKYSSHLDGMKMLKNEPISSSWSIYDHEDLEEGDIFIFNQVGTSDEDGIAGFGTFVGEPYAAQNWKENDGTNRFYAEFSMECMLDRRGGNIFSAAEMEKEFPQIDWHKGHAGVLCPKEIQEKLILYMMQKIAWMNKPTDKISFYESCGSQDLIPVFVHYINGCCPEFKIQIINCAKIDYKYFKEGEVIDKSLLNISDNHFYDVKICENSTLEDWKKLFIVEA